MAASFAANRASVALEFVLVFFTVGRLAGRINSFEEWRSMAGDCRFDPVDFRNVYADPDDHFVLAPAFAFHQRHAFSKPKGASRDALSRDYTYNCVCHC